MAYCRLTLVLLVFLVAQSFGHILRLPCKKFADFSVVEENSGLHSDAVLRMLENTNKGECRTHCMTNKRCKSFSTKESANACELYSRSTEDPKDDVTIASRPGWTYHSTYFADPLAGPTCRRKNPCPGRRCMDTCVYPGYLCNDMVYVQVPCCGTPEPETKTAPTETPKKETPTTVTTVTTTAPTTVVTTTTKAPITMKVKIVSQGYYSPNKPRGTVGRAQIIINGVESSRQERGYNVVVIDEKTGIIEARRNFDTHDPNKLARKHMKKFIDGRADGKIILFAIQDDAAKNAEPEAYEALKGTHGDESNFQRMYRGAFAMIGYKGAKKPSWVEQKTAKVKTEDIILEKTIVF